MPACLIYGHCRLQIIESDNIVCTCRCKVVVIIGIFDYACRRGRRDIASEFLESLKVSGIFVTEVTEEIAKLAGPLKAKFPQLSTADAIIATTAYINKAKLYTFDKGFYGIGGVDIIGI